MAFKETSISEKKIFRYENALRNLTPIRSSGLDQTSMGIDEAGLFSFIYSTWLTKYLQRAQQEKIAAQNLPIVSQSDSCCHNVRRLEQLWKAEMSQYGSEAASFSRVAWKFGRTRILMSCFMIIGTQCLGFVTNTILIKKILEHLNEPKEIFLDGLKWIIMLCLLDLVRALLFSWSWMLNYRTSVRLKAACLTLLYKKMMNSTTLEGKSVGEVINIFSNDSQRVSDVIIYGPMIVAGPVVAVLAIICILSWLSPMALLGVVIFLLSYPVQYLISNLFAHYRKKCMKLGDIRIQKITEILNCVKLVKIYLREENCQKEVSEIRSKEKEYLWKASIANSLGSAATSSIPIMSIIVTFVAHLFMGHNLTASVAFPVIAFFSVSLRRGLISIRDAVRAILEASVSFSRIKSMLSLQETRSHLSKPLVKLQALAIINGTFVCNLDAVKTNVKMKEKSKTIRKDQPKEPEEVAFPIEDCDATHKLEVLSNITIDVSKGELIGICGPVGSGKSSLLLAALGQLEITQGQVFRDGSCAYVSQQACIFNMTIKENILFGQSFDAERYHETLKICGLEEDLEILLSGDETEIGEKGVNLSGGQKQKIALARAFYSNRDIYFLDDPLSAVDAKLQLKLFDPLISALGGKTILLVSHQFQFLNHCDKTYFLDNGKIVECGRHTELMRLNKQYSSIYQIMQRSSTKEAQENEKNDSPRKQREEAKINGSVSDKPQLSKKGCLNEEEIKSEHSGWFAFDKYVTAGGGYFVLLLVLSSFILHTGVGIFSSWWLAFWLEDGSGNTSVPYSNTTQMSDNITDNPKYLLYQGVYISCFFIIILMSFVRGFVLRFATVRASVRLHTDLVERLMRGTMRFFETTPFGRIQNLFSRDMDEIDCRLPIALESALQNLITCVLTLATVILTLPWFIVPTIILTMPFVHFGRIYRVGSKNLKRLEATLRAPVYSLVTTSLQGLSTIRTYNMETDFLKKFQELLDRNNACCFMSDVAVRWLASRLDSLAIAFISIAALLVIAMKGQISPALAGLALSYTIQISVILQLGIRMISDIENRFVSVERVCHYLRAIESEQETGSVEMTPPTEWPQNGSILFENVTLKYDENSVAAVSELNCEIKGGEKIGIVGRTGSGKSSLVSLIYRLYRLTEGRIFIDDVDISKIDLTVLRKQITIIPQDSIPFNETVRHYLDPLKTLPDSDLWMALEKVHLKEFLASNSLKLDLQIGMDGKNFSVGERQLLCLARALLQRTKILILDEVTASLDLKTERAVHETIGKEFAKCTIIVIAHRLQTVLECDRVLVMENGRNIEFDNPSVLLKNEDSKFYSMFAASQQAAKSDLIL